MWIVDSGASSHVCSNPELLQNIYQIGKSVEIYLPDGSCRKVDYVGTARLNENITLTDVLFVQDFIHNLISVAQLIQAQEMKCQFYKDHCVFQDESTCVILSTGRMRGNLYIFEEVVERQYCNFFRPMDMSLASWHVFLGHPSITTMKHYKFLRDAHSDESFNMLQDCDVCIRAKQARSPFPQLQRRTNSIFELVHADVWGPYSKENINNTRFVLTLVEDHSKVIWTYLLSSKEEVYIVLRSFI